MVCLQPILLALGLTYLKLHVSTLYLHALLSVYTMWNEQYIIICAVCAVQYIISTDILGYTTVSCVHMHDVFWLLDFAEGKNNGWKFHHVPSVPEER